MRAVKVLELSDPESVFQVCFSTLIFPSITMPLDVLHASLISLVPAQIMSLTFPEVHPVIQ